MLETQLSCCGYLKNLGGRKIAAIRTFRGTPGGSALSGTAHTSLRCHSRESPSTELRAGCAACHALVCREGCFECLHTQQLRVYAMSLQQRSSVQPITTQKQFVQRVQYNMSPNGCEGLTCVWNNNAAKCFSGSAARKWRKDRFV